jgi:hypothetical protein
MKQDRIICEETPMHSFPFDLVFQFCECCFFFSLEGSAACCAYNQDYENTVYATISIIFLFISCSSSCYMFRSFDHHQAVYTVLF